MQNHRDRSAPTTSGAKPGENGENAVIDLNSADEATLAGIGMLGTAKARILVEHRPYANWNEVKDVPGLGASTVDLLAMAGVQITDPVKH